MGHGLSALSHDAAGRWRGSELGHCGKRRRETGRNLLIFTVSDSGKVRRLPTNTCTVSCYRVPSAYQAIWPGERWDILKIKKKLLLPSIFPISFFFPAFSSLPHHCLRVRFWCVLSMVYQTDGSNVCWDTEFGNRYGVKVGILKAAMLHLEWMSTVQE